MLSNLRLPLEEALDAVVAMEIPGVQLSVNKDHDAAARKAMKQAVKDRGLKISAICVDAGDLGETGADNPLVENLKPLMDAAVELCEGFVPEGKLAVCQTHVGVMPHTMKGPRWDKYVTACREIAQYGEGIGAVLAMETGPEPPRVLEALLKEVDSVGLGINYDPANFIIWPPLLATNPEYGDKTEVPAKPYDKDAAMEEYEPVEGVRRLAPYIVHTHAKDGDGSRGDWYDVPLGTGWVDWSRYLRLLKNHGYTGYLAIEREGGEDRIGEITHAANFLRQQLADLENM